MSYPHKTNFSHNKIHLVSSLTAVTDALPPLRVLQDTPFTDICAAKLPSQNSSIFLKIQIFRDVKKPTIHHAPPACCPSQDTNSQKTQVTKSLKIHLSAYFCSFRKRFSQDTSLRKGHFHIVQSHLVINFFHNTCELPF